MMATGEELQGNLDSSQDSPLQNMVLKLYVIGASPNSIRAIKNVKAICEEYLKEKYDLEIVDIYQQPHIAEHEEIIAVPLLIKKFPGEERRMIGDMSNKDRVLRGLGIKQ